MFTLPVQVAAVMREFEPGWSVAGGWAIDLFLEKETRAHQDIEVAVFRKDQLALHDYFAGWLLQKIVKGEQVVWERDEWLGLPTHEIHCFNETGHPPRIEVLLNESNENEWLYRRDQLVRRALAKVQLESSAGVKFLCPEIVLLYKSKNPRAKDEQDFQSVVRCLGAEPRKWLKDAIKVCASEHHWLRSL
ncbi:MAG: nucleotidyltransferase domain-containing protein [Pyrinomonadaceae bacterium]